MLAATGGIFKGSPRWWLWPPVAVGLWFVAWLASGLVQDAAGTALIALACLAAASAVAMVAPAWSIQAGLVGLAALDVVLVWGTPTVQNATTTLETSHSPTQPGCRCRASSSRSSAPRSWAGSTCSRPRYWASSWRDGESSWRP